MTKLSGPRAFRLVMTVVAVVGASFFAAIIIATGGQSKWAKQFGRWPEQVGVVDLPLFGCIDNVQAGVPLIHLCYDKVDNNVGLANLF